MKRLQPTLAQGIILFVSVIAIMIFICAPLQYYLGIWGLAITELILLGVALLAAKLAKVSFRDTFPMRLPSPSAFVASTLFYIGAYLFMLPVTTVLAYFFPQMNEVSDAILEIGTQSTPFFAVIIMALLPAICEETLHRGFILSSFRNVKRRWVIVLSMGIIFGLFHLDPYRFLPTAILGAAFSYIAIITGSMLLPMIFHLINNIGSVVAMYALQANPQTPVPITSYSPWQIAGSVMLYFGASMIFLFGGWKLLTKPKLNKYISPIVIIISSLLIIGGIVVTAVNIDLTVML